VKPSCPADEQRTSLRILPIDCWGAEELRSSLNLLLKRSVFLSASTSASASSLPSTTASQHIAPAASSGQCTLSFIYCLNHIHTEDGCYTRRNLLFTQNSVILFSSICFDEIIANIPLSSFRGNNCKYSIETQLIYPNLCVPSCKSKWYIVSGIKSNQ